MLFFSPLNGTRTLPLEYLASMQQALDVTCSDEAIDGGTIVDRGGGPCIP